MDTKSLSSDLLAPLRLCQPPAVFQMPNPLSLCNELQNINLSITATRRDYLKSWVLGLMNSQQSSVLHNISSVGKMFPSLGMWSYI